ncbi:MAG: MFS transporter [Alphaproteobacteria bacterium]|nr:MFS transporter [Alphaproteobacteria bacterium]
MELGMRRTAGTLAVAGELGILFVGATLPSPLYPLYASRFGFGAVTLTLVYAAYVIGNVVALMFGGRLSDRLGRRSVMLPALGLAALGALVFLCARGTPWLYAGRVLSGLATGIGAGAATAWLAELQPRGDKAAGALLATTGNFLGIAAGPVIAGLLAAFAPGPLRLPYLAYLGLIVAAVPAVWLPGETVKRRARGAGDLPLRPRLGVPREIRLDFLPPAVTAFVTFALIGFYAALVPNLLRDSLHLPSPAISGAVIGVLFAVAAVVAATSRGLPARPAMLSGLALLLPSVGLLVGAQIAESMPLLLAATLCAGVAGALGYRGSLQVVNEIAPAQQRGEVVSSYLTAVYLGNSLPIIGVGLLSAAAGALTAHLAFAAIIAALAVAALVGEARMTVHAHAAE